MAAGAKTFVRSFSRLLSLRFVKYYDKPEFTTTRGLDVHRKERVHVTYKMSIKSPKERAVPSITLNNTRWRAITNERLTLSQNPEEREPDKIGRLHYELDLKAMPEYEHRAPLCNCSPHQDQRSTCKNTVQRNTVSIYCDNVV